MEGRTEYPALLASLSPDQAISVLTDRVGLIKKINSDVADWLTERRKVEEAYVIGLRKLASRPQQDAAAALGIFQTPWQRIVASTENLAASHEILAQKIENDVEAPLRQFATRNREMQALGSSQSNLSSIAKELGNAQKKADKLNAKGGRKADEASTSVDEAAQQWESQAPYVFEQLQALDERRTNNLRDVLTQFQTHEVDQIERNRTSAESCLNALLNLETSDEIRTFAAKVAGGRAAPMRRRSSAAASARPVTSSLQVPPAPPPPRLTQDRSSRREGSQDRVPQALPETPQKSKLSGLKRIGTVMNRRKSMAPPPPPSEKKKDKGRSLMPFRRGDSSRSFQDLEETGEDLSQRNSREPPSTLSQIRSNETDLSREQLPTQAVVQETQPVVNGTSNNPFMQQQPQQAPPPEAPPQLSMSMAPLTPQQPLSASSIQPTPPQLSSSNTDPISRAQQEAYATPDSDEANRNFAIRDKPIQEDESEAQLAMSTMANQLRLQAQSSGVNRTVGSVRGRRDVRNTMFIPSGIDTSSIINPNASSSPAQPPAQSPSAGSDLASPIARPAPAPRAIHEDHALSDTHSVHSAHSLTTTAQHPELQSPGLSASIIETVNTFFSDSGITKSFVTGEIALSYNPLPSTSPPDSETIRLTHFELLEKVAANPTFVSSIKPSSSSGGETNPEEQAGTYTVGLNNIRRPTPTVGLKYQLHLDESNLAFYSPLLLTPAWQVIEGQTSVILLYSLNPTFTPSTSSISSSPALVLKNVMITISLDPTSPTRASSAMMSPTQNASFRRKAGSVTWKIPELNVPGEGKQERMLVRFLTPGGTAKRGGVEVRFEVQGRAGSDVGVQRKTQAEAREVDPFADDGQVAGGRASGEVGGWEDVETKRMLVTGRYSAT